jgi:hypothetical protein
MFAGGRLFDFWSVGPAVDRVGMGHRGLLQLLDYGTGPQIFVYLQQRAAGVAECPGAIVAGGVRLQLSLAVNKQKHHRPRSLLPLLLEHTNDHVGGCSTAGSDKHTTPVHVMSTEPQTPSMPFPDDR